ncbi:MAG: PAS domain S-box protein [Coriobacteriia bacterium]|nr:PAS domain S-box protein [Coriobacteriia bacterium]
MHARDEEQLLSQVCDAIVNTGGYPFVWVGYAEQDASRTVRPMAVAGARREDAEALGVTWSDTECGRGPTGAAIRMGRPVITRDIAGDQVFDPWREAVVKFGVASSIALPLSARGQVFGALTIYATHVDAFDAAEVALLTELVDDLAYGIEALRTQAAHESAQKALEASERQLALVLNNVSDVVFTIAVESDGGFHFAWVNHRFLDLTGLSEDQIIGARVQDVIPEPALTMVVGKYREAIETGRPAHWEEASEYPAGRRIGQVTVVPALDSSGTCSQLVGVVHDVTEREEAARALEESERQYRELVENANSIILRWARDGRVTFLNEFGQKFFGYSSDEIVGRHVMDTIVPATDTAGRDMAELMEEILSDPVAFEQSVNENMRRDGQSVWISWTNRIVCDADGEVSEILSVGTDITARRRAEQAIRDLNATLEQRVAERTAELAVAKDRAEAADRVKSAFLATMSHELRTPLNSIIGFTGIMLQKLAGPLTAEQSKQLGMVRDSSRHLLALINDVLDISKIEAGQLQVSREHFDLPGTIKKAVATVAPLAEKKGLDLRIEVAPEIGDMLSDPRRIEQVLLNLLNNAIKFTDDGVVTLTADIVPGASPAAPSTIRIAVADTGIGIRAEDMGQLFQSFRQIDTGLARQHEGTGLGLSICRRLAELLGGEMNAASELGTGSVFTLTLPAEGLVEA